jgi:short-subunit dehydrogenase
MGNYLVVGGSSGIGLELSNLLAGEGHQVYATFNKNGGFNDSSNLHYAPMDVLSELISFDFLPEHLNGMVYCPGSIQLRPFNRIKPEEFTKDFQLQVIGAIKVIQGVLPRLKAGSNPSVLLFSTVAVQLGLNFHSQVSVSKGAIEGLVRSLAAEFAPAIRVNAIAPSLTNTPLAASLLNTEQKVEANALRHPLKRIGTSMDIAAMASFLLSEKASWITGQIFPVDGGMSSIRI